MNKEILERIRKINQERGRDEYKPTIFNFKNREDLEIIERLVQEKKIVHVVDEIDEQVREFELVKNPHHLLFLKPEKRPNKISKINDGIWAYFPWRFALIHILNPDAFQMLRISRNKNLILEDEQKKYAAAKIAIAGLNVGNPAAICLALEGGGRVMKFADNDVLSVSNLNRFRASLADLGLNKAVLSARQVYEIDPFYKIEVFPKGIIPGKSEEFLVNPKVDVLVEEMDNLLLKIEIREKARQLRIPVVMVTGNSENVIIDVERFDEDPRLPLLNGHLESSLIKKIKSSSSKKAPKFKERILLARDFMGVDFLHERLKNSFPLVGSRIAGIPQIAESSFLRGAAVAYCVRKIVTGKMPSGRYSLELDSITS